MNVNVRELMEHVEYEPEFYYAAFSAELEICSSTMWSLLIHLNDEVSFFAIVLRVTLRSWFGLSFVLFILLLNLHVGVKCFASAFSIYTVRHKNTPILYRKS